MSINWTRRIGLAIGGGLGLSLLGLAFGWIIGWRRGVDINMALDWIGLILVLFSVGSILLTTSFADNPKLTSGAMLAQHTYAGSPPKVTAKLAGKYDWLLYLLAAVIVFACGVLFKIIIK